MVQIKPALPGYFYLDFLYPQTCNNLINLLFQIQTL